MIFLLIVIVALLIVIVVFLLSMDERMFSVEVYLCLLSDYRKELTSLLKELHKTSK